MGERVRVGLLAASPVHYWTPLYRRVAADPRVDFTAIFASDAGIRPANAGYGEPIAWDTDLLAGYNAQFLRRASTNPTEAAMPGFLGYTDLDVVNLLRRERYDALWIWGYNYATHLLATCTQLLLRRPVIFHEDQTLLRPRRLAKRAAKFASLSLLFRAGHVLYVGTQNRRWFSHYGVPSSKMFFTPHCVDNERLQQDAAKFRPSRREIREEFGITADSGPVILSVGRLIAEKQPHVLLEAFRRLRAQVRCTLLFVGTGELESSLRAVAASVPDVHFIRFLNQSAIVRAYVAADIFALVSKAEVWGLVVNEAMNCGLPIVASDQVGCAVDLVHNDVNGFIVPHQNIDDLAKRLKTLAESDRLRSQFGRRSVEIVDKWSFDRAADGVLMALGQAVGRERWSRATTCQSPDEADSSTRSYGKA